MAYDADASVFSVFGSTVSCLATLAVLVYCLASQGRHASLRHALIVNLCLADFLNTLSTIISGFIYVGSHRLYPGSACSANAFFALMTAQAADFTILAITLVSLLAVLRVVHLPNLSSCRSKLLICSSTWIIPSLTSLAGLVMDAYRPVGLNWCEVTATRPRLRYALVRGWRLAIILAAICLYAFICWFVHRHYSSFSATKGVKAPRGTYTSGDTRRPILTTVAPPTFSQAHVSGQAPPRPDRYAKETVCSEFSLPLQGYDLSGTEVQEREKAIDSRTERISRWIYVRHPGLISSISSRKPHLQSRPYFPQANPDLPPDRPWGVATGPKPPILSPGLLPPLPLDCRPHHHSQYATVQRPFDFTTDERPGIAISPPVVPQRQMSEPRRHAYVKSISSAGAHTQSSFETVPWRICSAAQPDPAQWPFLDASSSSVNSSTRASTPTASRKTSGISSRHHSHLPKAAQPSKLYAIPNEKFFNPIPAIPSERTENSSPFYRSMVPRLQHRLTLTNHRHERIPEHLDDFDHYEVPVPRSYMRSIHHEQKDASTMPSYRSQYPKVKRSFEMTMGSPREMQPGPSYYTRCPRPTETASIAPLGPVLPEVLSRTYQPGSYYTKPTIIAASREPPPPPSPALPPPHWSADSKVQRRKTFLLSRSTWSDLTSTQQPPSASDTAQNDREIRRTLLLNTYPLAYFIFWLPWMVMCFKETQGRSPEGSRAMRMLSGLPQYLGLVNAAIFAVNEYLKTMRRKARTAEMPRAGSEKCLLDVEGLRPGSLRQEY